MINKKGMTLVELILYMVLAALVLAPVIMLVNNSSVNMARDAGRANLNMSGREILQIIYDDLKNTGFKITPDGNGDISVDTSVANFYLGDYILTGTRNDGVNANKPDSFKLGYSKLVAIGGSTCNTGFYDCRNIIDPSLVFRRYEKLKPAEIKDKEAIVDLSDTGYNCKVKCSCEFLRDSSSFYSSNYYLFTSSRLTSDTVLMVTGEKRYLAKSNMSFADSSYPSKVPVNTIKCYDTLGVRMCKLKSDGRQDGSTAYQISYKVRDTTNLMLVREVRSPNSNPKYTVMAKNVAALKFRFSDNLKDWYDYFDKSNVKHVLKRNSIQYIKVIIVLRDPKKLSSTKTATPIILIEKDDGVQGHTKGATGTPELKITPTDQSLYERYEITVPIPNNGLFP